MRKTLAERWKTCHVVWVIPVALLSAFFHTTGEKNVFIFIWTCYYLVHCNCSDHVLIVARAQSWEEAQQNPCWHCHYLAWRDISQPRQWKYYYPSQGKFWFKLVLSLLQARAPKAGTISEQECSTGLWVDALQGGKTQSWRACPR